MASPTLTPPSRPQKSLLLLSVGDNTRCPLDDGLPAAKPSFTVAVGADVSTRGCAARSRSALGAGATREGGGGGRTGVTILAGFLAVGLPSGWLCAADPNSEVLGVRCGVVPDSTRRPGRGAGASAPALSAVANGADAAMPCWRRVCVCGYLETHSRIVFLPITAHCPPAERSCDAAQQS
mgnify:CR=1 FL=1